MKPRRGIHVQSAMRWLFGVVLKGELLTKPPIPQSDDPEDFNGGSANMRLLFCVCWYVRSLTDGTRKVARQRLLNWIKIDASCHDHGEPTSPSHGQLHAGAWGALALVAWQRGDAEILEAAIAHIQVDYAILSTCEGPDGPWLPGARGYKGRGEARHIIGRNPTWPKVLSAIRDGVAGGRANQYDLGAHCLALLPENIRARMMKWPATWPGMWSAFHARRYADNSFCAWYETPWKDAVLTAGHEPINGAWIMPDSFDPPVLYASKGQPVRMIDIQQSPLSGIEREKR